MKNKILAIVAHPDDEILGCGGTLAKFAKQGWEVYVLSLSRGVTSRYESEEKSSKKKISELEIQAREANKIIGTKRLFMLDFPDNMFDTIPLLKIVKSIEKIKNMIRPSFVFTHFREDLNIDHRITYEATITAMRPLPNETVKEILSFEIMSSTEWRYPTRFSPNVFVDISDTIDLKLHAMEAYKEELRTPPHPRSLETIKFNAAVWGSKVGLKFAEAFELIRKVC
ncbi:MAG: PIG-L deacetylase family protein [Candidatus Hadarchaeales archaeon]